MTDEEKRGRGRPPKPGGKRAIIGFPPDLADMVREIATAREISQVDYLDKIARKRIEADYAKLKDSA